MVLGLNSLSNTAIRFMHHRLSFLEFVLVDDGFKIVITKTFLYNQELAEFLGKWAITSKWDKKCRI